ncbi:MAG: Cysteine desulfurase SufS [Candidatus Phytoplasma pruni]
MKDNSFRSYFPIFKNNPKLVYFDSASTSLKPQTVIDAMSDFYNNNGINFRSFGTLSVQNNRLMGETREKTAQFINAEPEEIIFTKGTTESLNMLIQILSQNIQPGDEIITSELEHNSSVLPCIKAAEDKQAKLMFVPLCDQNKITVENFKTVLTDKTKIVVLTHMSNVLGYETPIKEIAKIAHQKDVLVILDAAQSVAHQRLDMKDLDVDFMAFSAHKIYGPFGVGVLYGKKVHLEKMKPSFLGGGTIQEVFKDRYVLRDTPYKFESGTPNIGSIIAFKKSLEFIESIGIDKIHQHNKKMVAKIKEEFKKIPQIKVLNEGADNLVLFVFDKIHAHDVESSLAKHNIYLRTGLHCANLVSKRLNQISTIRVSVGLHNTEEDIAFLITYLKKIKDFFSLI